MVLFKTDLFSKLVKALGRNLMLMANSQGGVNAVYSLKSKFIDARTYG